MSISSSSNDFFILSETHLINSTQIYHLLIKDSEEKQCYSFYFRYNSLKSLHKALKKDKSNKTYNKNIKFPSRRRSNNRINEFEKYFTNFLPHSNETLFNPTEISDRKHLNFRISKFLEAIGLESIKLIKFPAELVNFIGNMAENKNQAKNPIVKQFEEFQPMLENRSKKEKSSDFTTKPEKKPEVQINSSKNSNFPSLASTEKKNYTISELDKTNSIFDQEKKSQKSQLSFLKKEISELNINDKKFLFHKVNFLGGGGYGKVSLYSLNGSKDENHMFAIKLVDFDLNEGIELITKKINSILAESKLFMKFDHENIVKGTIS